MPELPEVEIVRQSLNRQVKNRKIINIQVNNRNLRLKVPKDFEQIFKNAVIEKIQRKSKYLILVFNNHLYCVIHLGMSGTLHFIGLKKKTTNLSFYGSQSLPKKHNHIIFRFKNFKLIYNDPRRFGFFKILKNKNFERFQATTNFKGSETFKTSVGGAFFFASTGTGAGGKSCRCPARLLIGHVLLQLGRLARQARRLDLGGVARRLLRLPRPRLLLRRNGQKARLFF